MATTEPSEALRLLDGLDIAAQIAGQRRRGADGEFDRSRLQDTRRELLAYIARLEEVRDAYRLWALAVLAARDEERAYDQWCDLYNKGKASREKVQHEREMLNTAIRIVHGHIEKALAWLEQELTT